MQLRCRLPRAGFTILELAVVIVIIAILAVASIPIYSRIQARAQRIRCMSNLRSLAASAGLYLEQNESWPQIAPPSAGGTSPEEFAAAWIEALAPFGASRDTWICPSIQNFLGRPDYTDSEQARIDYIPTPFDDKPNTPREWPRQPWFIESGDVHGNGNLIIFTDGSISDLKTVIKEGGSGP